MKHKGLLITLIVLGVVIVVPVGVIYGCFYDTTTNTFVADDSFSTDDYLHSRLVHAFDTTSTAYDVEYSVSEDALNNVIAQAHENLPEDTKEAITSIQVTFNDDNSYTFAFDVKASSIFQTHIELYTQAEDVEDTDNPLNGYYVFRLTGARFGRVGGFSGIALSLVNKYISADDIETALSEAGMHMEVDLENKQIIYTKANLLTDFSSLVAQDESSDSDLAVGFLDTAIENNLLSVNFSNNQNFSVLFDLSSMHENSEYTDSTRLLGNDIGLYRDKTKALLEAGIIDTTDDHATMTMEYLLKGYADSDEDTQNYVRDKDFSSVGISDNTTYTGADKGTEREISSLLSSQMTSDNIFNGELAQLSEEDFGYALLQSGIFGYTYLLTDEEDDGTYTVNYVTLDNCYCDVVDGAMSVVIGLNINGYETSLILDATAGEMQNLKVDMTVENLLLGTVTPDDKLKNYVYSLLETSLADSDFLSFSASTGTFSLDLTNSLAQASGVSLSADNITCDFVGSSRSAEGYIDFKVTL